MKTTRALIGIAVALFLVAGCSKTADENKPLSEVKADAEQKDADALRKTAMTYKDAILAKQEEVTKAAAKLKEIPVTEALGEEAKKLKEEMENLSKSAKALQERFAIYFEKLKEKKGDLSGLELTK